MRNASTNSELDSGVSVRLPPGAQPHITSGSWSTCSRSAAKSLCPLREGSFIWSQIAVGVVFSNTIGVSFELLLEGKTPQALSGEIEDGVRDGRGDRREAWLANPGGLGVALEDRHRDLGALEHSQWRERVEIFLLNDAVDEGDLLVERGREPVDQYAPDQEQV